MHKHVAAAGPYAVECSEPHSAMGSPVGSKYIFFNFSRIFISFIPFFAVVPFHLDLPFLAGILYFNSYVIQELRGGVASPSTLLLTPA